MYFLIIEESLIFARNLLVLQHVIIISRYKYVVFHIKEKKNKIDNTIQY